MRTVDGEDSHLPAREGARVWTRELRLRVLLVEDNPGDARLIREYLRDERNITIEVIHVDRLSRALDIVDKNAIDVVVLDLGLPDSTGLATLDRIQEAVADIPSIVLTGIEDEELGVEAVHRGAQDYLAKPRLTPDALVRSIRFAVERQRVEEVRRHLAIAQAALRERDEFMAIAAHELRTPVTVVHGYTQLLGKHLAQNPTAADDLVRRSVNMLGVGADRLLRLIKDVLDTTRLGQNQLRLRTEVVDICELVRQVINLLPPSATNQTIHVRGRSPADAFVDPLRVEQVIANLLRNAQKFSPADASIEIDIRTPNEDIIEIAVRDHGIGIPPEHRGRLFQRHFQISSVLEHNEGLGLGLFISHQIVQLHGGDLTYQAPPDGGSVFTIRLPRHPPHQVTSTPPREDSARATDGSTTRSGIH